MIPSRTFIMRPEVYPSKLGRSSAGKQFRVCHDAIGKRNIIFGGDFSNTVTSQTAAGSVFSYDPVLDLSGDAKQGWRQVSGFCHGPGKLTPSRPDDSQACGMDYKLDAFTCNPGGWRANDGDICSVAGKGDMRSLPGSTYYHGAMRMARDGSWSAISKAFEVPGGKNGHFDQVQRCLVCIDSAAAAINRFYVDDPPHKDSTPIDPATIGALANGRLFAPSYMDGIDWGIDLIGRWGYVLSVGDVWVAGNYNHSENFFWRFNLDKPAMQQALADPPFGSHATYQRYHAAGTDRFRCQFDSRNRKVVWFYTRSICGMVHGIGVYDPVTNAWNTVPIAQDIPKGLNHICANAHGYDSTNDVHILMGGAYAVPGDDPQGEEVPAGAIADYYTIWRL